MSMYDIVQFLRSIAYMWIALESAMITQLYYYGNCVVRKKKSNTIAWLTYLLASISLFFIFMALVPIVKSISVKAYLSLTNYFIFLTLPIIFSLHKFRKYTLKEK